MLQSIGPVLKLSTVELVDSERIGKRTRISNFPPVFFSLVLTWKKQQQAWVFLEKMSQKRLASIEAATKRVTWKAQKICRAWGCRKKCLFLSWRSLADPSADSPSRPSGRPPFSCLVKEAAVKIYRGRSNQEEPGTCVIKEAPEKWIIPVESDFQSSTAWSWLI